MERMLSVDTDCTVKMIIVRLSEVEVIKILCLNPIISEWLHELRMH